MYFPGNSTYLLTSVGVIFRKQRLLEAPKRIHGLREAEEWRFGSEGGGQRAELAGEWVCGPGFEAAVALRGPLSRMRVVGVVDGAGNGRKGGRVTIKEVDRTAHSEEPWK